MKRVLVIVAVTALLIAGGVVVWTQSSDERRPGSLLQQASENPVVIQYDQGVPRFMKGSVAVEGATPTERSYAYLDRFSELYALEAPRQELEVVEVESGEGADHVRLEQREGEIPVYGGELVVHLEGEDVVSTTGTYLAEVPKLEPKVEAESALATAREATGIEESVKTTPELTYFDADLLMTPAEIDAAGLDAQTHLAWSVELNGIGAGGELVTRRAFVDAQTGQPILDYDLRQSHTAQKNIWIRTASGGGPGWFCSVPGATDWFLNSAAVSGATPDAEGTASFTFITQVYDYFYNTFHRHSFDGNDRQMPLNLDFVDASPLNANNAAWIPTCNHWVFNNNMAQLLDVMAHEFTHAVIDYAVPGGIEYLFQPGALNESYADVFAVLIDTANWTIGERPGFNPFRDFSNPPAFSQPDTMPVQMIPRGTDNGGVHTNSGIPNKAAFLLMQGGFHNGRNVTAIGRGKVAQLYYEVLDNWLSKTSNFLDFRNATVSAATVWAQLGRQSFTTADVCRVVNAFGAVAIASGDADCDGVLDSAETDADNDSLADGSDNCPFISNLGQQAADTDGTGDACDTDDDNDTVLDAADNCPRNANPRTGGPPPRQSDIDGDGLGDVCDPTPNGDKDFDNVDDLKDNCKGLPNPDQLDTDTDGQGNRCDTDDDGDGVLDTSDNCQLKKNTDQKDTDKDGAGDACDDTPLGPDNDKDGDPDSSDPDDDNDTVKDDTDNCPLVANASQIDLDHDGTGHACDPDEALTSQGPLLRDAIDARARHFERFQIMVLPCLERCEPGVPMEIRLEVDIPLVTRLLDEAGNVIAEGSNKEPLVFEPKEDLEYRLEILPRDLSISREYPLELELIPKP